MIDHVAAARKMSIESSGDNPAAFEAAAKRFGGVGDARPFLHLVNARGFVASHDGEPVGWCWGYMLMRPDGSVMAYLHQLEVAEQSRRHGIGRALFVSFLGAAQAGRASKLFLTTGAENTAARHLYDSLGGELAAQGPTVNYWFQL